MKYFTGSKSCWKYSSDDNFEFNDGYPYSTSWMFKFEELMIAFKLPCHILEVKKKLIYKSYVSQMKFTSEKYPTLDENH